MQAESLSTVSLVVHVVRPVWLRWVDSFISWREASHVSLEQRQNSDVNNNINNYNNKHQSNLLACFGRGFDPKCPLLWGLWILSNTMYQCISTPQM